jgi:hypothetical protein
MTCPNTTTLLKPEAFCEQRNPNTFFSEES